MSHNGHACVAKFEHPTSSLLHRGLETSHQLLGAISANICTSCILNNKTLLPILPWWLSPRSSCPRGARPKNDPCYSGGSDGVTTGGIGGNPSLSGLHWTEAFALGPSLRVCFTHTILTLLRRGLHSHHDTDQVRSKPEAGLVVDKLQVSY